MFAPLPPGTLVFNRYRVVGLAGQGEFGLTYLAQDQKRFDELCMLWEFIPLQIDLVEMERLRQIFHQKAALLYELQHPQLPRYQIMFIQGDRLYLARDYIVGKSCGAMLHERREQGLAFSQVEVVQLLLQILPVLAYLHGLGIVHENLAPQSIVIRRQEQIPVLVDLGIVKRLVQQLQLHPVPLNATIGRVGYAAPEQECRREIQPGSDVFALGAIAVSLLLGKEPQEAAYRWLRTSTWDSNLGLHPDFVRILKRMLHPNLEKRFVSASQVLRALEPVADVILRQSFVVGAGAIAAPLPVPSSVPIQATSDQSASSSLNSPSAPSARRPRPSARRKVNRPKADLRASAVLISSVALLVCVVSFRALSWVQTEQNKPPAPANTIASPTDPTMETPASTPSTTPQLPTREASPSPVAVNLTERQQQLGVGMQFLSDLTDEIFYEKHPDLNGQKLTVEQADLQAEWTMIAQEVLTKLAGLSPGTRGKLGKYDRADYDRWTAPDSGASVNSRELNVLVNARFAELFPEQKGKSLNPKTFGQVWYALAEEELTKLKPTN